MEEEKIIFCKSGGCTAKLGAGVLEHILEKLPKGEKDPNLLVGYDSKDDASVYRLTDDLAMVQTLDFFPPVVEDPYTFGKIAAANALSDIYAMGGEVRTALNIVCFPEQMDLNVLGEIMRGGAEKVQEAARILELDVPRKEILLCGRPASNFKYWDQVRIVDVQRVKIDKEAVCVGEKYQFAVTLDIANLRPEDIGVEMVVARQIVGGQSVNVTRTIQLERTKADGSRVTYSLDYTPDEAGTFDVALRIFPVNPHLPHRMDFALVKWA